jgi:hypothetical protein
LFLWEFECLTCLSIKAKEGKISFQHLQYVYFSDFIKNFKYFLHEPNSSPLIPLVGNKKQRWRDTEYVLSPGKQPERVMARSVLAYWAVRKLGISGSVCSESGFELGPIALVALYRIQKILFFPHPTSALHKISMNFS